jgi:hypothetical protein
VRRLTNAARHDTIGGASLCRSGHAGGVFGAPSRFGDEREGGLGRQITAAR